MPGRSRAVSSAAAVALAAAAVTVLALVAGCSTPSAGRATVTDALGTVAAVTGSATRAPDQTPTPRSASASTGTPPRHRAARTVTEPSTDTSSSTVASSAPPPASPSAPPSARPQTLPNVFLAGVNDGTCRSAEPPVVLLHGTFSTLAANFSTLVSALRRSGRCVYGIDYGNGGVGAITTSAVTVTRFVGTVLAITGATRVDVVGYSQGGLVLRTALRLDHLADRVRVAVLIAPAFHGTTSPLAAAAPSALCPACADQAAGSPLLARLDAGGDLDGAVRYAVISTEDDTVVTPVSSQVPAGPADRVRSVMIQRQCPDEHVSHLDMPHNLGVVRWVVAALSDSGRPPRSALTCA